MEAIDRSPFLWLSFGKDGALLDNGRADLEAALTQVQPSEVVVMSHGWKNDKPAAWELYSGLWPNVARALPGFDMARILVVGVQWPSKRYQPALDEAALRRAADAGGGVLAAAEGEASSDLDDAAFEIHLAAAFDGLDTDTAEAMRTAIEAYVGGDDAAATDIFLEGPVTGGEGDPELAAGSAPILEAAADPQLALQRLASPPDFHVLPDLGAVKNVGDDVAAWFQGRRAAVVRLLEQFSYYEMKARAGLVGRSLGGVLSGLQPGGATRLHLIGHSFGARVVTAAAEAFGAPVRLELRSLTLLQGAFSHNGMSATRGGAFAAVVGKPSGPITITHTHNDKACTTIYALASRLSRDKTATIGDASDAFGSMGANGAQFDVGEPASNRLLAHTVTSGFSPEPGRVNNFRADAFIKGLDAHGDVKNETVGALVAAAIRA